MPNKVVKKKKKYLQMSNPKRLSGNKCVFYKCGLSCQKLKEDNDLRKFRTFTFPVNDAERCKQWILNSGNTTLANLSPTSLKKKVICCRHFTEEEIVSRKLPLNAIPVRYVTDSSDSDSNESNGPKSPELRITAVTKTYSNKRASQAVKIEVGEVEFQEQLQECTNLETKVKTEPGIEDEPMPELESVVSYDGTSEVQDAKEDDACACFGRYVAAELRTLPLKQRLLVQQQIQNCITSAVFHNIPSSSESGSTIVPSVSSSAYSPET